MPHVIGMTTALIRKLAHRPLLTSLDRPGQRLIDALRMTVLARRRQVDAAALLRERLECPAAARHALYIVTIAGDVWPERFVLSPPCCRCLSYDEALLGTLADHAAHGNRPDFDRDAGDLLSEDSRDQLWRALIRWQ